MFLVAYPLVCYRFNNKTVKPQSSLPMNMFYDKMSCCTDCDIVCTVQPSYRPVIEELENEEEDESGDEGIDNEDEPICEPPLTEVSTKPELPSNEPKSSRILIEEIHSDDIACDMTLDESVTAAGDGGRVRHVWGPETQEASVAEANHTEDMKVPETQGTKEEIEVVAEETECEGSCGDSEKVKGDAGLTQQEQNAKSASTSGTTEREKLDMDLESLD